MKDLATELKTNGGWLKPIVLNQVAGQPLQEIKAHEKENEDRKRVKEKFLQEYMKLVD